MCAEHVAITMVSELLHESIAYEAALCERHFLDTGEELVPDTVCRDPRFSW